MFDCIYRDEVKQKIKERMRCLDDVRILNKGDAESLKQIERFKKVLNQICCDIDDIRTADVQPVRYGQWIWDGNKEECICSECGKGNLKYSTVFCPDCGARMDGDIE